MTYSDEHECVFVHLIKTAGESVCKALNMRKRHLMIRELVEMKISRWEKYMKFSIVRNPWDRFVSEYHYNLKKGIEPRSFKRAVMDLRGDRDKWKSSQFEWLSVDGKIAVDKVLRFENIAEEFYGLFGIKLPHVNKTKHEHYSDYYTKQTRDVISRVYSDDIEEWGYEYDQP
jgi:hypothetical protein